MISKKVYHYVTNCETINDNQKILYDDLKI